MGMFQENDTFFNRARHVRELLGKKAVDAADLLQAAELVHKALSEEPAAPQSPDPHAATHLVQDVARAILTHQKPGGGYVANLRTAFWMAQTLAQRHPEAAQAAAGISLNVTHAMLGVRDVVTTVKSCPSVAALDRLYARQIAHQIKRWVPGTSRTAKYADRLLAWDATAVDAARTSPLAQDHAEALCENAVRAAPSPNAAARRWLAPVR